MVKKRRNHINLGDFPQKRNEDGRLICLNCGKLLTGRQEKYCGWECSNDWLCKHSHQFMRKKFAKEKGYICNKCKQNCEFDYILDHIKPIALCGAEFDKSNLQIICSDCNKIKTKQDHKDIAKLRRIEKKMTAGQITMPSAVTNVRT